jgi:hypothetical protein
VTFKLRFRRSGRVLRTTFKRKGHKGKNHFTFNGRLNGRKLGPYGYILVATAQNAGGDVSKPRRTSFTVARR